MARTTPTKRGRKAGHDEPSQVLAAAGRERSSGAPARLAEGVANRIVRDIAALGWPEGEVLGSEHDLLERYGVSRAVFREAVRLVEHQQVARMRRGPGGGLVVTAPSVDAVIDAVAVYLYYVKADVGEVFEARIVLEDLVAELAPERLTEDEIVAVRELLARERAGEVVDHRELHALLASLTDNPALEFFVDLLNRVSRLYLRSRSQVTGEAVGKSGRAHAAIADAVLSGDAGTARRRMRRHLEAEADYLVARSKGRIGLPQPTAGDKRGQGVAFQILEEVAEAGWPVGELLGSETELMQRYDVSRAVFREAVRVLEHHQVVRMRRGPGGGLFVAEPGMRATTEAVALLLDRRSIAPTQLMEVRTAIEMATLDRVIAHLDDAAVDGLEDALDVERRATLREFGDIGHDLHAVIARIAGNRVLELLGGVLLRLTWIHQTPPAGKSREEVPGEVTRVHELIVAALVERDAELARLRMRKHLRALTAWVR